MPRVLARLPPGLRDDLKSPLGPIFDDVDALLDAADGPIVTVGDIVTAHLVRAGRPPDLAVVDERTERTPVDDEVASTLPDPDAVVENPAASVTEELVAALREGLAREPPTTILVEGEEDLAALPLVLLVPDGASVVYGQPGEGMVLVSVDGTVRARVRDLLSRFEGDADRLLAVLEG